MFFNDLLNTVRDHSSKLRDVKGYKLKMKVGNNRTAVRL